MAEADAVEHLRRRVAQLARAWPSQPRRVRDHLRHQDVFEGGEFGQQVVELEDEAEGLVAQLVALAGRQVVDASAVEADAALVGPVEGAEQVQQRALAGAGGADDAEELAGADVQVDAAQDADDVGVAAIGLVSPSAVNMVGSIR